MDYEGQARAPYVVPRYRADVEPAWYHVLHGTVPGHQIDFIYCPEVPQGALTQTHLAHVARIIKYIEPREQTSFAFAIGNLSRDDVQHDPGHGGLALIFGLRVEGVVDHASRAMPPYAHGLLAVDRSLDYGILLDAIFTFYRRFFQDAPTDAAGSFYRSYVHTMETEPHGVERFLRQYTDGFADLPRSKRSQLGCDFFAPDDAKHHRITIIHETNEPFESVAAVAATLGSILYRSNVKWTSISNGREVDIPGGVSVRFVPESDAPRDPKGPVFRLKDLPRGEVEIAERLFEAKPKVAEAAPRMGWREQAAARKGGVAADGIRARQGTLPPGTSSVLRQSTPRLVDGGKAAAVVSAAAPPSVRVAAQGQVGVVAPPHAGVPVPPQVGVVAPPHAGVPVPPQVKQSSPRLRDFVSAAVVAEVVAPLGSMTEPLAARAAVAEAAVPREAAAESGPLRRATTEPMPGRGGAAPAAALKEAVTEGVVSPDAALDVDVDIDDAAPTRSAALEVDPAAQAIDDDVAPTLNAALEAEPVAPTLVESPAPAAGPSMEQQANASATGVQGAAPLAMPAPSAVDAGTRMAPVPGTAQVTGKAAVNPTPAPVIESATLAMVAAAGAAGTSPRLAAAGAAVVPGSAGAERAPAGSVGIAGGTTSASSPDDAASLDALPAQKPGKARWIVLGGVAIAAVAAIAVFGSGSGTSGDLAAPSGASGATASGASHPLGAQASSAVGPSPNGTGDVVGASATGAHQAPTASTGVATSPAASVVPTAREAGTGGLAPVKATSNTQGVAPNGGTVVSTGEVPPVKISPSSAPTKTKAPKKVLDDDKL